MKPSVLMHSARTSGLQSLRFSFERPKAALLAAGLASLKIKVGEIEEHNAVGRFEEVVGLVAKILLKLILYGIKVIGNSIYPPWSYFGHRKVKEFAHCRVLFYNGY